MILLTTHLSTATKLVFKTLLSSDRTLISWQMIMTRLWLLLELVFFVQCQQNCYDQNIRYNGDTLTVTNAKQGLFSLLESILTFLFRTTDDCFSQCQRRSKECGGWTWSKGKCEMKKLSRPGDKVAGSGMVSGTSRACSSSNNVTSVKCKYTDDNKVNVFVFYT